MTEKALAGRVPGRPAGHCSDV